MLQDVPDRLRPNGRIDRHADMVGHPDRQVRHDPPCRILRQDSDTRSRIPSLCFQIRRHAAGLIDGLSPSPVTRLAAGRLRQENAITALPFPPIEALQREIVARDAHGPLSISETLRLVTAATVRPITRPPPVFPCV